jgi:hypothetical protein
MNALTPLISKGLQHLQNPSALFQSALQFGPELKTVSPNKLPEL